MSRMSHEGTEANMPAAGGYREYQKTDSDRGVWFDNGTDWIPMSNHLTKQVSFAANGTTTTVGVIPANSYVKSINIIVTEAFNAGTTNTIQVGYSGTAGGYAGATDVSTVGVKSGANGSLNSGAFTNGKGLEATKRTVIATFGQTGTAASTGKAMVVMEIVPVPAIA